MSALERERIILPLQRLWVLDMPSQALGLAVSGEAILPLFAWLYWCVDQHKCITGIVRKMAFEPMRLHGLSLPFGDRSGLCP